MCRGLNKFRYGISFWAPQKKIERESENESEEYDLFGDEAALTPKVKSKVSFEKRLQSKHNKKNNIVCN